METQTELAFESQCKLIAKHLNNGYTLTQLEALRLFSCMRLASRVNDLRNLGMPIRTKIIRKGDKRYAQYSIEQ